ncbi:hypothetical protein ACO22_01964 [Paracoccidioides brasiliensis]|uniref:Uncharacterized protein n=1 Tax=Paracoccidioides brasiliensis TaxID=121759 RepID=A0A1D2JK33_PARBR|nr:hypothetical protein ACO22_01964 [Paracoccidioides brasiliensis]ODH49126.1 hypothetical protein GX48_04744 [Paracoccidioides brasiliensis]
MCDGDVPSSVDPFGLFTGCDWSIPASFAAELKDVQREVLDVHWPAVAKLPTNMQFTTRL